MLKINHIREAFALSGKDHDVDSLLLAQKRLEKNSRAKNPSTHNQVECTLARRRRKMFKILFVP